MSTKIVMTVNPDTNKVSELARFTLQPDGTVIANYGDDEITREEFEDGILVRTAAGDLRPSDGAQFFEALDIAFSQSSFLFVRAA